MNCGFVNSFYFASFVGYRNRLTTIFFQMAKQTNPVWSFESAFGLSSNNWDEFSKMDNNIILKWLSTPPITVCFVDFQHLPAFRHLADPDFDLGLSEFPQAASPLHQPPRLGNVWHMIRTCHVFCVGNTEKIL